MAGKKDIVEQALKLVASGDPQKTVKAYKLFKQRDGKLYPLFVDAKEEVPVGQWLKARAGDLLPSGKVKAEISGGLAYRPGWHAGDLPTATHIGAKSHGNNRLPPDTRRSDEVWAEVEMADDVDWQKVADERARITKKGTPDPKTAHITDQVPYGGHYRYKTSPTMQGNWLIGGDMRVNRVLTDDEVKAINEAAGVADLPRREGYGGGGEIVEQALKLIMGGADDAAEKAFANTRFKTPQGKPMRLYHMTPNDITEFRASPENRSGPAVFLSPYADYQPAYHQAAETGPDGEITDVFKEGANVMPVYADVRNPLVLDHPRKIKEAAAKYQGGDREFPRYLSPKARAALEAEGYDGIILGGSNPIPYGDNPWDARLGHQEARDEEFLVFDPRRIKSAITNTGEYDFTNPDITKAFGGQVRDGYQTKGRVVGDLVDKALRLVMGEGKDAANASNVHRAYHGTSLSRISENLEEGSNAINKFYPNTYFHSDEGDAASYIGPRVGPQIYETDIHISNPLNTTDYDYFASAFEDANRLKKLGYDAVVYSPELGGGKQYLVFDPEKIKILNVSPPKNKYAEGGNVVRDGYSGRGRVARELAEGAASAAKERPNKAMNDALRIMREGLADLARERSVSPAEIGKPFGDILPSVPYEEWRIEYTPNGLMIPQKPFDPSTLKPGDVFIPLIGDRTANSRTITSIAGKELERPVVAEGGPDYMRGPAQIMDRNVWASDKGAITKLNNRVDKALTSSREAGYKDPNAYGMYVAMGTEGGDFSTHTAEALMGMLPHAKILKKDVAEFDRMMRAQDKNWPGLMNPKAYDYVINADAGAHRKAFVQAMDAGYWRDKGFPDVSLARYATTTPDLVASPTEAAGYAVAKLNPEAPLGPITFPHRTYNTPMPGEYAGTMPAGIMRDDIFTQHSKRFDENPPSTNLVMAKRRSFERNQNAYQVMHDQDIQNLIDFTNKIANRYAYGGEVNDDDIDDAIRIAKDVGGGTPVLMEDAKGNKYDAQGNIIPPTNPGPNPQRSDATTERAGKMDAGEPLNYETEVKPFIDVATSPMNWAVEYPTPDSGLPVSTGTVQTDGPTLLNTMKIATQLAASGQPTDERGDYNWEQAREQAVRRLTGAPEDGQPSPYQGPFGYNPSDFADYINTLVGFSPVGWAELLHDTLYEAGRTGDYGNAAYEGGLNAALSAPGIAALGLAGRAGMNAIRRNPKTAAAIAGIGSFFMPDDAEAGPARWFSKAMEVANALPMEKMTGQQALAMLRKSVSPEELKWTGADTFLPQQKQITKKDLVDYLAKNRVQMNEVVLGGGTRPTRREDVVIDSDILAKYEPLINDLQEQQSIAEREFRRLRSEGAPYSEQNRIESQEMRLASEIGQIKNKMIDEQIDKIGGLAAPTKYHDYSTAGGEGYTETLYQYGRQKAKPSVVEKDGMWEVVDESGEVMRSPDGKAYSYWSRNDAERAARSLYRESGSYQSPHWNDPDVIAHTRSNTLTYEPPGSNRPYKVHNVEETQSDLAQQGRKTGFRGPDIDKRLKELDMERNRLNSQYTKARQEIENEFKEATKAISDEYKNKVYAIEVAYHRGETNYREYEEQLGDAMTWYGDNVKPYREKSSARYMAEAAPLEAQEDVLRREVAELNKSKNLPPLMPYVGSTEGWTDFAIKRELDKAFDSDADYFSWSPGDVHAERYGLSNHISKVQYNPDDGSLLAYDPKGKMVVNESVNDPSDLDEYLGKELADKMRLEADSRRSAIDEYEIDKDEETGEWTAYLYGEPIGETFSSKGDVKLYLNEMMANEFAQSPVELSGLDLKVGGEGMRGYYDKIYLKRVQDVIKKSTGVKPEIETITVNTADGPRQQLGIRITEEMREKARFSDFNKGGRVSDPVVNKALSLTANM